MPERAATTEGSNFKTRLVKVNRTLFLASALIHLLLVTVQPLLAGWSLDGDGNALDLHGTNGSIILTIAMILIPLGILWWRPGRESFWAPIITILLFIAETFQLGMGYADILIVHVPLGVGIVIGSFLLFGLILKGRRPARVADSSTS